MKRIIVILLIIMLFLASCGVDNKNVESKYQSFVCDMANDGIVSKADVDYWMGISRTNDSAPQSQRVVFEGEEYNAVYYSSWIGSLWPFEVNEYHSDDNKATFYLRADNDELVYYGLISWTSLVDKFREHPLSLEEARDIADELAEKHINITEYFVTESIKPVSFYEGDDYVNYYFEYVRYVDGLPTTDTVNITLGYNGGLIFAGWPNAGLFSDKGNINIDISEIDRSVESKLEEVYGEKYDFSYEQSFRKLTYTPEMELAVVTGLNISLLLKGGGESYNSGIVIVTIMPD